VVGSGRPFEADLIPAENVRRPRQRKAEQDGEPRAPVFTERPGSTPPAAW
jgi:hypothetical protein